MIEQTTGTTSLVIVGTSAHSPKTPSEKEVEIDGLHATSASLINNHVKVIS